MPIRPSCSPSVATASADAVPERAYNSASHRRISALTCFWRCRTKYLLGTGTGLAPFTSIIRDAEIYERFEQVIVVHGVRTVSELGYSDYIRDELPANELIGGEMRGKLRYYPTVTREPFENQGRITHLLESGRLGIDLGLPMLDPEHDRVMICGSAGMLRDTTAILEARDFEGGQQSGSVALCDRARVRRVVR